jgi:hypothetical protein
LEFNSPAVEKHGSAKWERGRGLGGRSGFSMDENARLPRTEPRFVDTSPHRLIHARAQSMHLENYQLASGLGVHNAKPTRNRAIAFSPVIYESARRSDRHSSRSRIRAPRIPRSHRPSLHRTCYFLRYGRNVVAEPIPQPPRRRRSRYPRAAICGRLSSRRGYGEEKHE